MILSIIVAVAKGGVIGVNNSLIWHISEDLRYFKSVTTGSTIIMGRKSYESIGRPLPNRRNIVVSRNSSFTAEGCEVVSTIDEAISLCNGDEKAYIIGGGEIYRQTIDMVDMLYVTHVDYGYEGDTYFPEIDQTKWGKVSSDIHERGEKFEHPFEFATYKRK